jgi:sorting nexin-29
MLANILYKRLVPHTEETLGAYQHHFRSGRITTDNRFQSKLVLEKNDEFGLDVYLLFIDFKQAYDTVDGEYLYQIFMKFWILKKLFNVVGKVLIDSNCKVKI